jgi:hypothetical protein
MDRASHPAPVALSAAIADAAEHLRVPVDQIAVEYLEARDWSDSCLGLPRDGEACLDMITPGYLVMLGDGFRYRTDLQGNVRRETVQVDAELRVDFRQAGGIGDWTSEYHADDSSLPPEDATRIRQFIDDTDFFHLPARVGNGDPVPDLYSYTIFVAHGRRNHTVSTYDGGGPHESPALAEFITWFKERTPEPSPKPQQEGA